MSRLERSGTEPLRSRRPLPLSNGRRRRTRGRMTRDAFDAVTLPTTAGRRETVRRCGGADARRSTPKRGCEGGGSDGYDRPRARDEGASRHPLDGLGGRSRRRLLKGDQAGPESERRLNRPARGNRDGCARRPQRARRGRRDDPSCLTLRRHRGRHLEMTSPQ